MGPGTRVFEVDCGDGAFLFPFHQNGFVVGGSDADAGAIAHARAEMRDGIFQVGAASSLDPAVPWHVVLWRPGAAAGDLSAAPEADYLRGVLARMFAKATHAIAVLGVSNKQRRWMLHAMAEIGASAVQIEDAPADRCNVFARV